MKTKLIQSAVVFALATVCSLSAYAITLPSPSNCPVPCWSGANLGSKSGTCTKTSADNCTHRCNVYQVVEEGECPDHDPVVVGYCYKPSECSIL